MALAFGTYVLYNPKTSNELELIGVVHYRVKSELALRAIENHDYTHGERTNIKSRVEVPGAGPIFSAALKL
jgi:hypothetical protein